MHFARAATGILRATNMSCCMWPATRRLWSRWWSTGLCMESGACGCVAAAMWSEPVDRDGYHGPRFQWIGGVSEEV